MSAAVDAATGRSDAGLAASKAQATAETLADLAAPVASIALAAARATSTPAGRWALATPVHTVAATIQLAATRGFSHVRLALNPPELGGVEVLVRSSAAGVVASLTADTPEAARLLDAGAADLRRQLEAQGIELLRVDVGVAGDRAAREGDRASAAPATRLASAAADAVPDLPAPVRRIALGGGVLIDVIA